MPSPRKKRIRNILIGIAAFLLLAAIIFQLFINSYLEPIIRQRLDKLIVAGSDSLYNFRLEKVKVNFWAGSVKIENFKIDIDSSRYAEREKAKSLPALTFSMDLGKGSINGINLVALAMKKKISIQSIISKNTDLKISRHFVKSNEEIKTDGQPLWKTLRPDIDGIAIDRIMLDDINLNYSNADSAKAFTFKLEHLSAVLDNTNVDSVSATDTSRILFTKNIFLQLKKTRLQTADALYTMDVKNLEYSSLSREINIDSFYFRPVGNIQSFYKQVGLDKDRFNLSFPKIKLVNFYLPGFIHDNQLLIDTVLLDNPQINIYKDRTVKPDMSSKYGKYPHQLLNNASFTIRVKRVVVNNADLIYTEKNQKSNMEGKLFFQNLKGTISNITNDPGDILQNPNCVADISGTVMKQSPLHTVFTFHLNDAQAGGFEVSADIEKLDAAQLNPITVPLAQTSVKSFNMHEMHYYIRGNERSGTGSLRMLYDDLQVELNEKDEDDGKMKKKGLVSFIVNKFVVYKENNAGEKERKAAHITTARIRHKSFFNLVWKTLFNSTKEITIRIDGLKEDKKSKKKKK